MKRICLIVDHPSRDLDGLVLVACELAARGAEVFLVPMYQCYEALMFRPDLVLVNYVRYANLAFTRLCTALGVRVGVLDTEGGVHQDVDEFAERVSGELRNLSLYCAWGRRQWRALVQRATGCNVCVEATGCPRYDFAVEPWAGALKRVQLDTRPTVLVNTNFPIVNPRFQSVEQELRDLVHGMGFDDAYIRALRAQNSFGRAELVRATQALAKYLPDTNVVVRPHPFEDASSYEGEFCGHANVAVRYDGSVMEWIRRSSVVVHLNCSTAIEAFLMGKEPILLAWVDAPLLEQPLSRSVSQRAESPDQLLALVSTVLGGGRLAVSGALAATRRRVIEEFFYANDGRAAARVTDLVLRVADGHHPGNAEARWRFAIRLLGEGGSMPARFRRLVAVLGGNVLYEGLRRISGRPARSPAKRFGAAEVGEVLRRLAAVHGAYGAILAEPAIRKHAVLRHPRRYASVRVALGT